MFEKKEAMSIEESEEYGRKTDARNAALENVEVYEDDAVTPTDRISPPLSEEEIKKRVGEGNYTNVHKNDGLNSVNS